MKIAFIVEFPTQFEVPFYQYVYRWIKEQRVKGLDSSRESAQDDQSLREHFDFHVIYNYTDQKDYHDFELGKKVEWGFDLYKGYTYFIADVNDIQKSVEEIIDIERYDFVILNGYKNTYKGLAELCKRKNIPIGLRIDAVLYNLSPLNRFLKRLYLPYAYRYFDHFFAVGSQTRSYLHWLGIANENIHYFSYAIDDVWFKKNAEDQNRISFLKSQLGLKHEKIILSVTKFIDRESPWDVLKAFTLLNDVNYALILVGDGRDRSSLESYAKGYPHLKIIFTGYIPYLELPYYYGLSHLFIHAVKNEPWGVSVQEAIASGCSVITSNKVGSSSDLIVDGINGFIYPYNNVVELKNLILDAFKLDETLKDKTNIKILENWGYNAMWEQIRTGAQSYI